MMKRLVERARRPDGLPEIEGLGVTRPPLARVREAAASPWLGADLPTAQPPVQE